MARESRGSNAFGWIVLGFLAGVAATLAVLTYLTPSEGLTRHPVAASSAPSAAPDVVSAAAPAPVVPKPVKAPVVPHEPPPPQTDQQVQDDAAAAGMTSRRDPNAAPPTN
jgi:hypothetical protein